MLHDIWRVVAELLGIGTDPGDLDALQMSLRTVVVYFWTLFLVRAGSKRFLGKGSAFDIIVAIMLGSIMSRAINGSGAVVPTLVSGIVLLVAHWFFAWIAKRFDPFGSLIKGASALLIKDGQLQEEALMHYQITQRDLAEAMRLKGKEPDFTRVREARIERDGRISFLSFPSEAQVVEVEVQDGVQKVRIEVRTK